MGIAAEAISYRVLAEKIGERIMSGQLKPGERLLSWREMAKLHGVSVAVVRSCFEHLERQGLLVQRHGSGTFVNPSLQFNGARLVGLITSLRRNDIENYYEPLFDAAPRKRFVPMVCVGYDRQNLYDLVSRKPDGLLVDAQRNLELMEEIRKVASHIPMCYCNRWELHPEKPDCAVLTDYAAGYAEALRHLSAQGHERIVLLEFDPIPPAFLREQLAQAKSTAGFQADDPRILSFCHARMLENSNAFNDRLLEFKPTAVFGLSDFIVHCLAEACPAAAGLEKVGFFNQKWSQTPGREFTSFEIDFSQIWEKALDNLSTPTGTVSYVAPRIIRRMPGLGQHF